MANPAWNASGDYFETCTCDFLCPCLSSNLAAPPTKGECVFAFAFRVDRGRFGGVPLDGLCFALAGVAPGAMGEGNWKVGLIVDERVDAAQEQALAAIASGQAGGPMPELRPLITSFLDYFSLRSSVWDSSSNSSSQARNGPSYWSMCACPRHQHRDHEC